jgi:hypothetical protein
MVSSDLMELLKETANEIMQQEDGVHGDDWLNENRTSKESDAKGGVITLRTDNDWPVAFMVWYYGRPEIVKKLPRE